jgi:lipopolysaccharide biosynthesis protein
MASVDPTRWVVYACFDSEGRPAPHAIDQLAAYRALGFNTVVVDTSPQVTAERAQGWDSAATAWLARENVGYDFLSYRRGLSYVLQERQVPIEKLHLVLANDSCFGPFVSLQEVFDRFAALRTREMAVMGITDSHERQYHLQSYWLYFLPAASALALHFLGAMPVPADRQAAIDVGELGLSEFLAAQGCELCAYCTVQQAVDSFIADRNRAAFSIELGLRRLLDRPKLGRTTDSTLLRRLLGRRQAFHELNASLGLGAHLFRKRLSPFVKRALFDSDDVDSAFYVRDAKALTNADIPRILSEAPL